uniref:Uncharacterized protein n=1 Tax=Kalanchoe fedtschenkoi TaxID=63787 RepID=A0A7N0VME7_KALFE
MVKNHVPDWLNSSLWSAAASPDDDRPRRHSPKYTPTPITPIDSQEASIEPPMPEPPPPPPLVKEDAPPTQEECEQCPSKEDEARIPSAEELARTLLSFIH